MPIQSPQWTEFLSCPVCCNGFDTDVRGPVTLGCGHSICRSCITTLHRNQCPFDQALIRLDVAKIPLNRALVRLVGGVLFDDEVDNLVIPTNYVEYYLKASQSIQDLVVHLKPYSSGSISILSKPMQRKLVTLANCQLLVGEGRARALRAARSLGERTVTELLLHHQNPQQLSANLWAAVRARGCQFLGPAMQEEVLKLVLLALEDGSALSRKVLVMFVVQRLEPHYTQASKTSIGHVVQLLYRASCFKVSKREGDSSLMQLKEEFRSYDTLRREHDAQIVQIATEAGLRIAPDQWSALLYGDTTHKSHMQSIMDKLQTPQAFFQSVQELVMALQRSGDPGNLSPLRVPLALLASIDPSPDPAPTWEATAEALEAARMVVDGLAEFISQHGFRRHHDPSSHSLAKYKTSMCWDLTLRGLCPRGASCTFAHSELEMDKYRNRKPRTHPPECTVTTDASTVANTGTSTVTTTTASTSTSAPTPTPTFSTTSTSTNTMDTSSPAPSKLFCPSPTFTPFSTTNPSDSQWMPTDKFMDVTPGRDVPMPPIKIEKPDVLLPSTPPQIKQEDDFESFDSPMSERNSWNETTGLSKVKIENVPNRFPGFQGSTYGEIAAAAAAAAAVAFMEPSTSLNTMNPDWLEEMGARALKLPDFEIDEVYPQEMENLDEENQLAKQKRSLERKFMDLYLEEIYEAGIAEDIKELEQRWETELAEQERRWSEAESHPFD